MKSFTHPKQHAVAVKSTDLSYKIIYTTRIDYPTVSVLVPLKDKYTASLWLSKFAVHNKELELKNTSL